MLASPATNTAAAVLARRQPFGGSAQSVSFNRSIECAPAGLFGASGLQADHQALVPVLVPDMAPDAPVWTGGKWGQGLQPPTLPEDCTSLVIQTTVIVYPMWREPARVRGLELLGGIRAFVTQYAAQGGFGELALRYVGNLANGRFVNRNRAAAKAARVRITWDSGARAIVFDPLALDTRIVCGRDALIAALREGSTPADLDALVSTVAQGLFKEQAFLDVAWTSLPQPDRQVYPTTDLFRFPDGRTGSRFSGVAMQSAPAGSCLAIIKPSSLTHALRCIDDWHDEPEPFRPIAVEPDASRPDPHGPARDGYTHPDVASIRRAPGAMLAELVSGQPGPLCHYFAANIVRGGPI